MTTNNFILGKDSNSKFISVDGYQHIMLFAPTGSGKGVSFVLPNLLSNQDSIIVHDIKGENYELTKTKRESFGQKIYIWNPLDKTKTTHRFNPFDFIAKDGDERLGDLQQIAKILINNDEDGELRGSFVSIALKHNNFSEVISELRDIPESIIKNKLFKYLEIFLNPFVEYATSTSDFDISKFHEEKSTLYVKLEPSEMNYLQPLMSFFYQFALTQLNKNKTPKKPEAGGVALILDEFATLGKMDLFINAISYCRGYHVRLCLLAQNIEQLKRIYGDATNELIYNSSFKVFFGTESEETRKLAIQVCKNQLKEEQILSLEKMQEVILIENEKPIIANKIKYFEESAFKI